MAAQIVAKTAIRVRILVIWINPSASARNVVRSTLIQYAATIQSRLAMHKNELISTVKTVLLAVKKSTSEDYNSTFGGENTISSS